MDAMVTLMENKLSQFNKTIKSGPIELVISLHVANHILYSTQALSRPRGHVILIGDAGSGRRSCAMVSALLLDYEIFQVYAKKSVWQFSFTIDSFIQIRSRQEENMAWLNGRKI